MSQTAPKTEVPASAPSRAASRATARSKPFCGLIDPILVEEPVLYSFSGSISRDAADAAWTWVLRDLSSDIVSAAAVEKGTLGAGDLAPAIPEILQRMRTALDEADGDTERLHRFRAQYGRDKAREEIEVVMAALRARALLPKAQAFGKAINAINDDAAMATAIQSMPLKDAHLAALMFQAALGHVANPSRIITAMLKICGKNTDAAVARHGFNPIIEAFLAHAQNQLQYLRMSGPFADIDLVCRGLDRYHRLVRALTGNIEFTRGSTATQVLAALTKSVSDRVEPRLKEVVPDLNQALRKPREGADRLDNDKILSAISGMYLLAAVRDSRESLALNAVYDQAWTQSAQALEVHIQRCLDATRQNPGDTVNAARLDAAIQMAEIRFNAEYAETLRRARTAAERRG